MTSEWVSGWWLNSTAFLGTSNSEVYIVHISRAIIAYTLESLTWITHNLQATINYKKKDITRATFETSNYPRQPWDWYTAPNSKCIGAERPPPPPKKKKKKNEKLFILVSSLVEKIGRTVKQCSDLKTSSIPIPLQSVEAQLSSLSLVVLLILFVCHLHSGSHQYNIHGSVAFPILLPIDIENPHHYWNVVYW